MGIPKYRQWLQERFPGAFTTAQTLFADHVVRCACPAALLCTHTDADADSDGPAGNRRACPGGRWD